MVDHQIDRNERFDDARVLSHPLTAERIAARSTSSGTPVKSCRTTRATTNGISSVRHRPAAQRGKRADIRLAHLFAAVKISQHRFEHDADRDGKPRNLADALPFELRK